MTTFASDTFTDTDGTALTAHTSDSGHSWSKTAASDAGSSIEIHAGGARNVSVTTGLAELYVISATPPSADYTVAANVFINDSLVSGYPGIMGRCSASGDTQYALYYEANTTTWFLGRTVSGSGSTLGSWNRGSAYADGTTVPVILDMAGGVLTCTIGGVVEITVTDGSPIAAAGFAGILAYNQHQLLDNFVASSALTVGRVFRRPGLDGLSSAGPLQLNPSLG